MHLSQKCLVRIVPRAVLGQKVSILPTLSPYVLRSQLPTLIDSLLERKAQAEAARQDWPSNLRFEKEVEKSALQHIHYKKRMKLLKLRKEQ